MLNGFRKISSTHSNNKNNQFWQQHNKPVELWSNTVIEQKIDYIHNNPVVSGFVEKLEDWKYSSAKDFCNEKGLVNLCLI